MRPLVAYNEIDPYAVDYMRWLMAGGMIAPGHIFTCSIEDLAPRDLSRFVQFHAFAGMGVWSYALRLIGWPDDRPIWSGSCPCQPFSEAGQGAGFDDERHLWPAFFHLIAACRPQRVVGEQVAGKDGLAWLDLVSSDLEACDYAGRAVPLCSAGFGAADIRNRLYWVGDAAGPRPQGVADWGSDLLRPQRPAAERTGGHAGGLADTDSGQQHRFAEHDRHVANGAPGRWIEGDGQLAGRDGPGGMADAAARGVGSGPCDSQPTGQRGPVVADGGELGGQYGRPGPLNGFWSNADWLRCTDGRWRPVEPGTFPLAHGVTARMGRLRAAGNAINAQVAANFLRELD